jgi:hypothetical protein
MKQKCRRSRSLDSSPRTEYSDEQLITPATYVPYSLNNLTSQQKKLLKNNFIVNCDAIINSIDVFELFNKILMEQPFDIGDIELLINARLKKLLFKSVCHEVIDCLAKMLVHIRTPNVKHNKLTLLYTLVFLTQIDYSSHIDLVNLYS